jgi:hypothetical protein
VSLVDELQKLQDLHRSGALSDEEFARAKKALLEGPSASPADPQLGRHLSDQLAEVHYQNELAQIDREWQMEREKYLLTDRYGRRQVPTPGMGIGVAVVGGVFGLFWTIVAIALTGSAPDVGPFSIIKIVFPLFGVLFIVAAIAFGVHCRTRAQQYEKAFAAYQARRKRIRPD